MSHYQSHMISNKVHKFEVIGPPPSRMLELITGMSLELPSEIYQRQGGIMEFCKGEASTALWSKTNPLENSLV
jgi:hypothetical protein